tara:strand:- start:4772 stop:5158 length:387 start_codon:yes stop_codon:yes gene_type:complete
MHLYGILRGRPLLVDWVKNNMQDIFLPHGKDGYVQLIPRKVELTEIVFPKKYLPEVVKTLGNAELSSKMDMQTALLRKTLGLKKIPKIDLTKYNMLKCRGTERVMHDFAHFTPIGIKSDIMINGVEQL